MGSKKTNGFQSATNFDGSPIQPNSIKEADHHASTHKSSSTVIWVTFVIAGLLVAGFYCLAPIHVPSSDDISTTDESQTQTEISDSTGQSVVTNMSYSDTATELNSSDGIYHTPNSYAGGSVKEAADSFMAENYLYYEFITAEETDDSCQLLYQIREDNYYLSTLTPITLSCSNNSNQSDYYLDYTFSDPEFEWHLDGEWYYSDISRGYYVKINRCEGETLYVEYMFYENEDTGEITDTQSSDGEIALQIVPENEDGIHYYTTGDIRIDIYPFGVTPDAGGTNGGLSIDGVWLQPYAETGIIMP